MKKSYLKLAFIFLFSFVAITTYAQKPPLDTAALSKEWPYTAAWGITTNGEYLALIVSDSTKVLIVRNASGKWQRVFNSEYQPIGFSDDCKHLLLTKNDSAGILTLGIGKIKWLGKSTASKITGNLVFSLGSDHFLTILDVTKGVPVKIKDVSAYWYDQAHNCLVLETEDKIKQTAHLTWCDRRNGRRGDFYTGAKPQKLVISANGDVAFTVKQDTVTNVMVCPFFAAHTEIAYKTGNNETNIQTFTADGRFLYVEERKPRAALFPVHNVNATAAVVNIWNYRDGFLVGEWKYNPYIYIRQALDIRTKRLVPLDTTTYSFYVRPRGDVAWVPGSLSTDKFWRFKPFTDLEARLGYIINLTTGIRQKLPQEIGWLSQSPDGLYVIGFDKGDFFSFSVTEGALKDISKTIQVEWHHTPFSQIEKIPGSILGWGNSGTLLYVQDSNDIWALDPTGAANPVCITNRYGARHHIAFTPVEKDPSIWNAIRPQFFAGEETRTRGRNIFTVDFRHPDRDPQLVLHENTLFSNIAEAEKAEHANAWIVPRQSVTLENNFFYTKDLRHFVQLTDIQPHRKYNWLTDSLFTWRSPRGDTLQGILYKPENFDPRKKYPVIFYYYQDLSENLNDFPHPALASGELNIPFMVSNGYLVFTPDIYTQVGRPGTSALDAVTSAARMLIKFPFVDSNRMGLQGHSFGGYETNYIVAHSHLFAAACAASGVSDFVSDSFTDITGAQKLAFEQFGQYKLNDDMWHGFDTYVSQSAVYNADQVTTPLLLMSNNEDDAVSWEQGREFFLALWRLEKPVWWLQYYEEGHILQKKENREDFTIRMQQFFDHYLKGMPAPQWMLHGGPAAQVTIDSRLTLVPGQEP